jgi:hypothetical protein
VEVVQAGVLVLLALGCDVHSWFLQTIEGRIAALAQQLGKQWAVTVHVGA